MPWHQLMAAAPIFAKKCLNWDSNLAEDESTWTLASAPPFRYPAGQFIRGYTCIYKKTKCDCGVIDYRDPKVNMGRKLKGIPYPNTKRDDPQEDY